MKVFEIEALAKPKDRRFKEYAGLVAEEEVWSIIAGGGEGLNGIPYGDTWKPQPFLIDNPVAPRPNFWYIGASAFVCDLKAREVAGEALEMSGELLPITIVGDNGEYWIYNATNCINAVDVERSEWIRLGPGPSLSDRMLKRPVFIASRFGEETLFKIPEDRRTVVYCAEFSGDPNDGEFKAVVEHNGLTGLEFKLIWSE